MDLNQAKIALSSLKMVSNSTVIAPLLVANAQAGFPDDSLTAFTVFIKKNIRSALAQESEIRALHANALSQRPLNLEQLFENGRMVIRTLDGIKTGSAPKLQYTLSRKSTGVVVENVGATSGLYVNLDSQTSMQIKKSRFIAEYISYEMFDINIYNAIMDRVVILRSDSDKNVREVQISQYLLKLALLQEQDIVLDTLLANPGMVLVLGYKGGKLTPVKHPLVYGAIRTMTESLYGVATYTAPGKAKEGYIEYGVNLKGMVRHTETGLISTLGAKKVVARQEKLNGDRALVTVKERVFLVTEVPENAKKYFNTGCFYASHEMLFSLGCSRLTADWNNLLVKGVTHYAPWIAGQLGLTTSICASSSAKGGVACLLNTLGYEVDTDTVLTDINCLDVKTITLLDGTVLNGVYADITVKVTNAYTIENFMRARPELDEGITLDAVRAADIHEQVEDLLNFDKERSEALSKEIFAKVASSKMSIIDVLCEAEEGKFVQLKPAITTVTPGEFENIALTFGRQIARDLMDYCLANPFNKKVTAAVKAASEWLKGEVGADKTLSAYDAISIAEEIAVFNQQFLSAKPSSMGDVSFLRMLVQCLGLNTQGWMYIPEMNCHIPCGEALYGDLFQEKYDNELQICIPTGLKYVISTLGYLAEARTRASVLNEELLLTSGHNLKFFIQDSLISKKTAKLKVHGKYMTLLPGFWLKEKHHVTLLSRDYYQPNLSHLDFTKVNIAKHPVLFLEAIAGFMCFKDIPGMDVSNDLRAIFMNTVFVHPDYLLELQNDTDGDLARVTFEGYFLPFYTGAVMESMASAFHEDYKADENNLDLIDPDKEEKFKAFTHLDLYKAMAEASESKDNVALFTDNLHKLQAGIRTSPTALAVLKQHGKELGGQVLKDAVIMTATLIQTDAMNAIKHDGGVTAGAALTSTSYSLENATEVAQQAVMSYLEEHGMLPCIPAEEFSEIVAKIFEDIHGVTSAVNSSKPHLTNQIERLTFKNKPNITVKEVSEKGVRYVPRRLDLFGMYRDGWNVTGANNMFAELVAKFFGR